MAFLSRHLPVTVIHSPLRVLLLATASFQLSLNSSYHFIFSRTFLSAASEAGVHGKRINELPLDSSIRIACFCFEPHSPPLSVPSLHVSPSHL